jgi:hypothetical protein
MERTTNPHQPAAPEWMEDLHAAALRVLFVSVPFRRLALPDDDADAGNLLAFTVRLPQQGGSFLRCASVESVASVSARLAHPNSRRSSLRSV